MAKEKETVWSPQSSHCVVRQARLHEALKMENDGLFTNYGFPFSNGDSKKEDDEEADEIDAAILREDRKSPESQGK